MKTAITILQEMMMRIGQTPDYECVSQSGPQHLATFEYKCVADGEVGTGVARSKKEAKQEAARAVLAALQRRGRPVPAEAVAARASGPPAPRCHVALLRELADQYRLPAVTFDLVGDSGPPHMRRFTVRAAIAHHARLASASTKKLARDLAAEQLYAYLRENLRVTRDFAEEEALARAHDRAMDRYRETREDLPWRPDLSQKVADYHLGLVNQFSHEGDVRAASAALEAGAGEAVEEAARALGLRVERCAGAGAAPATLALTPTSPPLVFAGRDAAGADRAAARFLRLALALAPSPPPPRPDADIDAAAAADATPPSLV